MNVLLIYTVLLLSRKITVGALEVTVSREITDLIPFHVFLTLKSLGILKVVFPGR